MKSFLPVSMLVFALSLTADRVWSDEVDELREKAKAMQREVEQLVNAGNKEEAENLQRRVQELQRAAEELAAKEKSANVKVVNQNKEVLELEQRLKEIAEKESALKEAGNKEGLIDLQRHRAAVEQELKQLSIRAKPPIDKKIMEAHPPKKGIEFKTETRIEPAEGGGTRRIKRVHVSVHVDVDVSQEDIDNRSQKADKPGKLIEAPEKKQLATPPASQVSKPDAKQSTSPLEDLRREIQQLREELQKLREQQK